ncbi:ABC transporter permease [Paradesulfitobacterium aromaticivorans]
MAITENELYVTSSPMRDIWLRLKRNKLALLGLFLVVLLCSIAIFAGVISPYDPTGQAMKESLRAPSAGHLMGTDVLGRDILSRVFHGARASLIVGVVATGISLVIGVFVGAVTGYYGGWVDSLIMRITDIFFAFPFFLLAIAIMTFLGPSFINVFIALGLIGWTNFARLVRGQVLAVKASEYVEAARAVGASNSRIIWKHVLPNTLAPIIVYATMNIGNAILSEAGLSFLGIGVQPPNPSWGLMLSEGTTYIWNAPWMVIWPGVAIFLTVLGFNLLGDGLRDALDPRLKE